MTRTLIPALLLFAGAGAARAADAVPAPFLEHGKMFAAAWNANDAKALAALWAEDGDLIDPHGRPAKGRAEVEKFFAELFGGPLKGSKNDVKVESVRMLGSDYAVADWSSTIAMKAPDGSSHEIPHHVTVVMASKGGKWWVVAARPVVYAPPPGK